MSTGKSEAVSPDVLSLLVSSGVRAVLVYGSVARGEHHAGSDLDILQIVDDVREQFAMGNIQVAPYTWDRLEGMARNGSLFIAHLVEEGRPLYDPENLFQRLQDCYREVPLAIELRSLQVTSCLLDVSSEVYKDFWPGLHKCAAFVLRSLAYVQARQRNCRSFSLARVTEILGDTRLVHIITIRSLSFPDERTFRSVLSTMRETRERE